MHRPEDAGENLDGHEEHEEYAAGSYMGPFFQAEPSAAWELPGQSGLHSPAAEAGGWGDDASGHPDKPSPGQGFREPIASPASMRGEKFILLQDCVLWCEVPHLHAFWQSLLKACCS